jgi:hypothetical protein
MYPYSVFIGDYFEGPPEDHHDHVPPLKIADLGLAVDYVPKTLRLRYFQPWDPPFASTDAWQ